MEKPIEHTKILHRIEVIMKADKKYKSKKKAKMQE